MPKISRNRIVDYRDADNVEPVPAVVVAVNKPRSPGAAETVDLVVLGGLKADGSRFATFTRLSVPMGTSGPLEGPEWMWPDFVKEK